MGTESNLHAPAALPPAPNEQESGLAQVRLDALKRQTLLLQRIVLSPGVSKPYPSHSTDYSVLASIISKLCPGISQEKNRIHSQADVRNTWILTSNLPHSPLLVFMACDISTLPLLAMKHPSLSLQRKISVGNKALTLPKTLPNNPHGIH